MVARAVLITGSSRGLGLEMVKQLAEGSKWPEIIIATCRNPTAAKELQQLAEHNSRIHIAKLDVGDESDYSPLVSQVSELVGPQGLNLLINNAGVAPKSTRITMVKWQHMVDTLLVNSVAPVMLTKALLPQLKVAASLTDSSSLSVQRAAVINISSTLGSIEKNDQGGLYPYRASKYKDTYTAFLERSWHIRGRTYCVMAEFCWNCVFIFPDTVRDLQNAALNAITKSLSLDLRSSNVLVSCLCPGWVQTDMGGKNAVLTPQESISHLLELLQTMTDKHHGNFYSHDGQAIPW